MNALLAISKAMQAVKFCSNEILKFLNWGCWLMHCGCKTFLSLWFVFLQKQLSVKVLSSLRSCFRCRLDDRFMFCSVFLSNR